MHSVEPKAIQTRYADCHFRSRLEARWAVFFDALNIQWQYEPQGFEWEAGTTQNGDEWYDDYPLLGGRYLPDFWLPNINKWFEVKGGTYTDEDRRLHFEFAVITGQQIITAVGDIPRGHPDAQGVKIGSTLLPDGSFDESMYLNGGVDFDYRWCVCPWCDKPGIEFEGRGARVCGYQAHHPDEDSARTDPKFDTDKHWRVDDKCYTNDHPAILNAYAAARSARFEHRQSGQT